MNQKPIIALEKLKELGFKADELVKDDEISYQVFKMEHKDNIIEVTNDINQDTGEVKSQGLYVYIDVDDTSIGRTIELSTLEAAVSLWQRLFNPETVDIIQQPEGTVEAIEQDYEQSPNDTPVHSWNVLKGH